MTEEDYILQWHQDRWQELISRLNKQTLGHAYLVSGKEGIGKRGFLQRFIKLLLCLQPGREHACDRCQSCQAFGRPDHPDLILIASEKPGQLIGIEQIRELQRKLALSIHQSSRRVVMVDHAELLSESASNALLKTLEEPMANNHLFLVAERPGRVKATIRSRCMPLALKRPRLDDAFSWCQTHLTQANPEALLALADGAPLLLGSWQQNQWLDKIDQLEADWQSFCGGHLPASDLSERWLKIDISFVLQWLQHYFRRQALALGHNSGELSGASMTNSLPLNDQALYLKQVAKCYFAVARCREQIQRNAQPQLAIESLLISVSEIAQ